MLEIGCGLVFGFEPLLPSCFLACWHMYYRTTLAWSACSRIMLKSAIVLYCIYTLHLYGASCSANQSEALPMLETQREESPTVNAHICKIQIATGYRKLLSKYYLQSGK